MKFEVPYNFDPAVIDYYCEQKEHISYIYLPPFKDDAINSRTQYESNIPGTIGYMPSDRKEYEFHLAKIAQTGINYCVLWQQKNKFIDKEIIKYYENNGAKGFIVANDHDAIIIKNYNKHFIVISSITRKLSFSELQENEMELFDGIVLFFPFNRALDAIKKLNHLKNKLILIPNNVCYTDCPATHHWFPEGRVSSHVCLGPENTDKCCLIYPDHLFLFDDYVGAYKLQGRNRSTEDIIGIAESYFLRSQGSDFFAKPIEVIIMPQILKMGLKNYYNLKSKELIDSAKLKLAKM